MPKFTHTSRSLGLLIALLLSSSLLLSACGEQEKVFEVAIYSQSYPVPDRLAGLKDGLKALAYVEGKNIRFHELDTSTMSPDQGQAALKDLVAKNYDAYWTVNTDGAKSLQSLTKQPIIVVGDANMVGSGLAQSVARPGANLTGVDRTLTGRSLKQLGWLLKIKPDLRSLYVIYDPKVGPEQELLAQVRTEASRTGFKLVEKQVPAQAALPQFVQQLNAEEAQAILFLDYTVLFSAPKDLKEVVLREKLIMPGVEIANFEAGALFSYDVTQFALGRQSAVQLDKVLHGTNPATMPIEAPTKLELSLNQKLADQFGLKFPQSVVAAADNVVK